MVSVGGFTGFVCTKRLIRAKKKDAVSKNNRIRVDTA